MTPTPLVTVIIPVWNGAAFLPETLRSLQSQTCANFEALILDDGSTDDTAAVAKKFCDEDPRLRLVSLPHAGLSATRNAGIEMARGEFIAFLDADDVWFPEILARQMESFRADPRVNFAYANYYFWDGERDLFAYYRAKNPLPDGDAARQLIAANVYGVSMVVVRRDLFARAGNFDTGLDCCEDWDMWLRLLEHGLHARGVREPLARYRRWPGSLSAKKFRMATRDLQVLEKNLAATRRAELRPLYLQSIRKVRAKLELAQARQWLDTAPDRVPGAIWRAWRWHPRPKYLMWFALAGWPKILGGGALNRIVHGKLVQKF